MSKGINGSPKTTTLKKKEWTKGTPPKPGVRIEFTLKKKYYSGNQKSKVEEDKNAMTKTFYNSS